MDKLTFRDEIGEREFVLLNTATPVVMFNKLYFPAFAVFPYMESVNWEMGYMVAENGRIIPSKEAPAYIHMLAWCKEGFLLGGNLN